ncbi:hypothetical protein SECTIM467_30 [Brevibacillus phage SecTim467]|uniref:Uncharacterized protein n=2 Tax=Jenstvirus jenst TaxID=1982225 RepID=A0A0K2CPI7_9CAUD|nr:hypothetical protein AVV11_gp161 [Brevibacillus phage Jenst]ALA07160.1 hypothetical protein JENST_30 [Brevibacillus phage Jenst]ALA07530.1 hypothetical protein SECTIM467_30 [Brevibacillus phage SecTim467]
MGQFVNFDQNGYLTAIKRSITDELNNIEPYILNNLRTSFGAIEIRKVDAKHKTAMQNSIKSVVFERADSFIASFGAGGEKGKQNQGFRAVYYEYGTGNSAEPPVGWSSPIGGDSGWGAWNMARKGRDIYQRPRGTWFDLGGNPHTSKIKGAPKKLANEAGSFGEEVHPQHWFEDAMKTSIGLFDDAVRRAVKSIPIPTYISIRNITKRM